MGRVSVVPKASHLSQQVVQQSAPSQCYFRWHAPLGTEELASRCQLSKYMFLDITECQDLSGHGLIDGREGKFIFERKGQLQECQGVKSEIFDESCRGDKIRRRWCKIRHNLP